MITSISESIIQRFIQIIRSGRLGHAYLFVGPVNIGKAATTLEVAKLVNCLEVASQKPCGQCESCQKIEKGIHPDVGLLKADETGSMKIEAIRQMIKVLQLKPYEGKKKVSIVLNIEDLTMEAANCLLKTLEEPTPDTLLLLTCSHPENVVDTIKSRCQVIKFFATSADHLPEYKNHIIDQFVSARHNETFFNTLAGDKGKTDEALDVLLSFLRDILLIKNGVGESRVIHRDRISDLKKVTGRLSFDEITDCLREVVKTKQSLQDNFNIKIALSLIKEKIWPE